MIKKFEGGSIEYRLPNYSEAQILLGQIGFGVMDNTDKGSNADYVLMGKILKHMGEFITAIKIKDITTYDELLNSSIYARELDSISVEITNSIMDFISKKKSS